MAAGEVARGPARWRGGSSELPSVHQGPVIAISDSTALTRQLLHRTTPLASLERSPWPVGRLPYPLS